MPTVTEIAKLAGVSKGLVSRLLRDDPSLRISAERKSLVLGVRADLMRKEKAGPEFESKKRLAYNIVIPCLGKDVFDELHAHWENDGFRAFRETLEARRFRVSITLHEASRGGEVIEELINSPGYCDALLLLRGAATADVAGLIVSNRFPHVCTDFAGEMLGMNTVLLNVENAIHLAVSHLKDLDHRSIGFLGRRHDAYPLYLAALARNGFEIHNEWSCISPKVGAPIPETQAGWRDAAVEPFGEWLDRGPAATAMICHNDYGALGAVDALKARGMAPGRDISLVGFDNVECRDPDVACDEPLLTTFDVSLAALGVRYADVLLNQLLHNQRQIVHERIPMQFIERASTGPCPTHAAVRTDGEARVGDGSTPSEETVSS